MGYFYFQDIADTGTSFSFDAPPRRTFGLIAKQLICKRVCFHIRSNRLVDLGAGYKKIRGNMRNNYWDAWKGIAILAVVAIHATRESEKFPAESFVWYFGLVFRQIINFAVPMFLALAGYFAARSSTGFGLLYYRRRLGRILPPYLFWTFVYVLLKNPSHFFSIDAISKDIFLGTGIGIGYFIVVLVQFILITPFILTVKGQWRHILIMAVVSAGSMLITYEVRINQAESALAQFPMYTLPFFIWYPFYHLGIYAARQNPTDINTLSHRPWTMFSLFVLFTVAAVIESVYLAHQGFFSFGASQIKITSFMASISLFMFSVLYFNNRKESAKNTRIAWLGRHSYPIYLTHLLFLPRIESVLKTIPFVYSIQPLFVIINAALALLACTILICFVSFAFPNVVKRNCLGA